MQKLYKRKKIKSLTSERTELLNEINFPWTSEARWMERYNELKEFKRQYKDISELPRVNPALANWCNTQRQHRIQNRKFFTAKKIKLLNKLNFPWRRTKEIMYQERWMKQYNELKKYMRQGKDWLWIVRTNPKLAKWGNIQREYRRKNIKHLTQKRINLLNEINFVWNNPHIKAYDDERWMKRYNKLKRFVRRYKRFPALHDDKKYRYLYIWVRRNRANYHLKASCMTPKRIKLLNGLKIEWQ